MPEDLQHGMVCKATGLLSKASVSQCPGKTCRGGACSPVKQTRGGATWET